MKELASVDTRRITDLQCASYLSTKQIPFTTERDHQGKVVFVFDNRDGEASKYSGRFFKGEVDFISPSALFSQFKNLRALIFNSHQ